VAEETFRATRSRYEELQRALALAEQGLEVEQTKCMHAEQLLEQLGSRAQRLTEERGSLQPADASRLAQLREEMASLEKMLQASRDDLAAHEARVPQIEQVARDKDAALEAASQRLAGLEARLHALAQLQERLARGAGTEGWLDERGLGKAPRLWHGIRIEAGWEDALEAVLRERLNAIALEQLEQAVRWFGDPPPGKITVYAPAQESAAAPASLAGCEPLGRYVTCSDARSEAL